MPVTKSILTDASALTLLVNTAYRGEESKKGWTTEAHLLSGNRIDEQTMLKYLADGKVSILKYTDDTAEIKACVYLEDKQDHMYLGMLSVSPRLQAAGIGGILLQAAESFARHINLSTIRMTVISSRTELIGWYKRRGYRDTGELLPFHIPEKFGIPNTHIQLLVMEKKLTTFAAL